MGSNRNKLVACLNCAIILPMEEFKINGCPNCPFLETNNSGNWQVTTSSNYTGQISILKPRMSWVAKWQRNTKCIPGFYAMLVEGELPENYIEAIEENGSVYFNRSKSFEI